MAVGLQDSEVKMKLGLQLYTVRKKAKKHLYESLKDVSEIGYKYVEAARINFDENDIESFRRANADFGTEFVSSQIKFHILDENFSDVMKFLKATNCSTAIISVMPTQYILGSDHSLIDLCKKTNILAKKYKDEGIQLCYHHHDFEFFKSGEGVRLDILAENFDENVKFIIDTYWTTKGGYAADRIIENLAGRVEGVHLRDYAVIKSVSRKQSDFALGDGVIDFNKVIETSKISGVNYGAVEQNTKNPLLELQKSAKHIEKLGFIDLMK